GPTVEQEEGRRASRERDRLVKERTAHGNRIKALLRLMGMAVGQPRRSDWLSWLSWLKGQRDWQGKAVPAVLFAEVAREHGRLMLACQQIAALERESAIADDSVAGVETTERRVLLRRLKSLGPVFSASLTHEVFYKDFRNRREV